MKRALVLAGGGERAVAWERGVVSVLEGDFDLTVATSAGAFVASGVEPGTSFGEAVAAWMEPAPSPESRRRRVGALAASAAAADWPAGLAITAIDVESGERVTFREGDAPLMVAVAAARAIPGLRPPVEVAGRRYMDGAVGSATNADLAAEADELVIVTPNPADAPEGTLFALWQEVLEAELEGLGEVTLIQAGPEDQEAMGFDMMSGARAEEAFAAGRRAAGRLLE